MARRILSDLFMSLDGVVESPEKWSLAYWNDEIQNAMSGGMFDQDALLLGRVTYEEFAAAWSGRSNADDPGTEHMNTVRKYVATRNGTDVDWTNSVVLEGDLADAVRTLKAEDGGDIAMSGSPTLVRWLIGQGLLDRLNLLVYPLALGQGARLFDGLDSQVPLSLVNCTPFSNGVVQMQYEPAAS